MSHIFSQEYLEELPDEVSVLLLSLQINNSQRKRPKNNFLACVFSKEKEDLQNQKSNFEKINTEILEQVLKTNTAII